MLSDMVVDTVIRKVFTSRRGVQLGKNESITDLMFADDSIVFADTEAETSAIIHDIKDVACSYGLTINADKTKVFISDSSPGHRKPRQRTTRTSSVLQILGFNS